MHLPSHCPSPRKLSEMNFLNVFFFSPSSSEGRSTTMGCRSLTSPPSSYVNAIRGKGKASLVEDSLASTRAGPWEGFMTDAHRSVSDSGTQAPPPPPPWQDPDDGGAHWLCDTSKVTRRGPHRHPHSLHDGRYR
jgi:hypothetical protein